MALEIRKEPVPETAEQTPKDIEARFREMLKDFSVEQLRAMSNASAAELNQKEEAGELQVEEMGFKAVEEELFAPKIPANENNLKTDGEITAPEAEHLDTQVITELENASIKSENTKIKDELIGQLGMAAVDDALAPQRAAAAGGTPRPPTDPTIVPPQVRDPLAEDPAIVEMRGVGSNWADAGRLAKNIGKQTLEQTAAWLPHSPFGRLAARVERAGMRLMNAPQELAYAALIRWRSEHGAAAEIDFKDQEKVVAEMSANLAKADAGREAFITDQKAKGLPTADTAMKLEGERNKVLKKIEAAQKKLDGFGKTVEDLNARKAGWVKREHDLAERTMANIDQRIAPEKGTMDALTSQKGEIQKKLESLKRARDMGHEGLQELEAKLKLNPSLINNVAIPDKIAAVKELLGRIDDEYAEHTKATNRIDSKLRKDNNYISGWMGYRNEEARVTTQDRRYFKPGDQNIEDSVLHEAPNLTHAPDPKVPEPAAQPESAQEIQQELEIGVQDYLKKWNTNYGNELRIENKDIVPFRPTGYSWSELPLKKIEDAFKQALEKKIGQDRVVYTKTNEKVVYTAAAIEERLKKLREAFAQDQKDGQEKAA